MSTKDLALGRYSSMPSVGGAPIVESGSNSDGEWTRWADGTQYCHNKIYGTVTTSALGAIYRAYPVTDGDWIFPVSFVASPEVFTMAYSSGGWCNYGGNAASSTSAAGLVFFSAQSFSGAGFSASASAIGRYK